MKKILAISGSNSINSINTQLANYAAGLINNVETQIIDLKGFDIPIYSTELEKENGIPNAIQSLFNLIQEQDGFVIASPEHNGLMPAAFKNVIDWLSRVNMKFLGNKPVLLLSTSPGGNGGANNINVLKELLPWWGGKVSSKYSLGKFFDNFKDGKLSSHELTDLKNSIKTFNISLETSESKAA
jgi:NAD(P)H-dependent FMN reductase